MIPNEGRNAQRDNMVNDGEAILFGDGMTSESLNDTSLENQLLSKSEGSNSDVDFTASGDGTLTFEGTVALDELNGEDISEVGIESTATFWLRIVHQAVSKQNDFELKYEITVEHNNV